MILDSVLEILELVFMEKWGNIMKISSFKHCNTSRSAESVQASLEIFQVPHPVPKPPLKRLWDLTWPDVTADA